jgi:hypothetical protein
VCTFFAIARFVRTVLARTHAQAERDILEDRQVPEQCVVLEHEPDLAVACVRRGRVLAVERHGACIGPLEARDDAQ